MTLSDILNEERDNIKARFAGADSTEAAQEAMRRSLERLLFRFMEQSESERVKQTAAHLAETVKASVAMLDTSGEPEIWEKEASVTAGKKKGMKLRPVGLILALVALAVLAAGVVLLMTRVPGTTAKGIWELPLALIAAGALLLFAGGLFIRTDKKALKKGAEKTVILHMDAGKLYRALQAVAITMDRQLALAEAEEREDLKRTAEKADAALSKEELELLAGLMEAAMSHDEEYALEKAEDVRFYLHNHGIETVDYTPEHESWFELLPSEEEATIRPALVSDGRLLMKGLAAVGTESGIA